MANGLTRYATDTNDGTSYGHGRNCPSLDVDVWDAWILDDWPESTTKNTITIIRNVAYRGAELVACVIRDTS